jgi:peroxiredoxin
MESRYLMKRIVPFVFLMLLFRVAPVAQNVFIKGKAEGRVFEKVSILVYDDNFSKVKRTLASAVTDEQGNFSIRTETGNTTYALLKVELNEGELYLKPGADYDLIIFPDTLRQGSVFDKIPLQFDLQADDGGLNDAIGKFNALYNAFLLDNFRAVYQSRDKEMISRFEDSVKSEFSVIDDEYVRDYIKYSLAQLEWISKTKGLKTLMKEYFLGKEILYGNIQYAEFFKEFFKDYVNRFLYNRYFGDLRQAALSGSLEQFDSIFGKDQLLASDIRLKELVMINTAALFCFDKNFSKTGLLHILKEISGSSTYAEHRKMAADYMIKLTRLTPGSPAPDFSLPMANGRQLALKDLKGSFVLLDFLKADCNVCLAHLDFLSDIKSRLGAKVKIVLMVYGKEAEKVSLLLKNKGLDWPVLFVGKRTDILSEYDVAVFPTYIIIAPDGTIGMAPAPMADENLERELTRLMYNWQRKIDK